MSASRLVVALACVFLLPGIARGEGPALTVPADVLAKSLTCGPGVEHATSDPVLLTPAFSDAQTSYGWNYLPQLEADGIPHCQISVADEGYGDLQATAESVVYAVRRMHAMSGRKVVLLGHQHGALDELWALTFWPDVARSVSDLVSLETPYHGTTSSTAICGTNGEGGNCEPATRQITAGSHFVRALEAAPLPRGVAVTSISSTDDTLITPQPAASHRDGARNIVLQDLCPGPLSTTSRPSRTPWPTGSSSTRAHPGPADPARLPPGACGQQYMAKSNPAVLGLTSVFLAGFAARNEQSTDAHEPVTRAYAQRVPPRLVLLTRRARVSRSGHVRLRLTCTSVGATACATTITLAHNAGRRHVRLASGRPTTVRLKLRSRRGRARERVRVHDALGNTARISRRISLR